MDMTKVEAVIRFAVQSQKSIYKTEEKHNEKGIINFAPALHDDCNDIRIVLRENKHGNNDNCSNRYSRGKDVSRRACGRRNY